MTDDRDNRLNNYVAEAQHRVSFGRPDMPIPVQAGDVLAMADAIEALASAAARRRST